MLSYRLPGVTEESPKDTEEKTGVLKIEPGTSKKSRMSRFFKTLLMVESHYIAKYCPSSGLFCHKLLVVELVIGSLSTKFTSIHGWRGFTITP
jgi:hypothetical protein